MKQRMKQTLGVMAAVCIFCCAAAEAVEYEDIRISAEAAPSGTSSRGYVEYVFTVTNLSQTMDHTVTLQAPANSYGSGDYIRRIRRRVVVGPASTVSVSLLQPPLQMNGVTELICEQIEVAGEWITHE